MDLGNYMKGKKGLIIKTWERCKSFHGGFKNSSGGLTRKTKSWPRLDDSELEIGRKGRRVAPEGCFTVVVGAQRQRFVIKTEYVNHPLFKMLLEEAESEYGYNSHGPLALPCNVDMFVKVLVEMDETWTDMPATNKLQLPAAGCMMHLRRKSSYSPLPSPLLSSPLANNF